MRVTRSQVGDAALAAALAVIGIVSTIGVDRTTEVGRTVDAPALVLVAGTALILVIRRRWPLVTLGVAAVLTSTYLILSYPYGLIFIPFVVAVYTAARYHPMRRSAPAAGAALAILLLHLLTNEAAIDGYLGLVPGSAWVAVPYAVGAMVRINREAAERQRAETLREHVYNERFRVAREVHDVVGHGLAAIKMQADVALHVLGKKPEQAEPALRAISRTSAEALDELRATLAAVRRAEDDESRGPAPGVERLDALRDRMSDAGLQVHIGTSGTPRELPAAVDLTAYRIIQESLTNVLRHGESHIANVEIAYDTDAVTITVTNPGSGAATGAAPERPEDRGDGLGITGMRQRVTALGGDFSAGPTAAAGFRVHTRLPTERHS